MPVAHVSEWYCWKNSLREITMGMFSFFLNVHVPSNLNFSRPIQLYLPSFAIFGHLPASEETEVRRKKGQKRISCGRQKEEWVFVGCLTVARVWNDDTAHGPCSFRLFQLTAREL